MCLLQSSVECLRENLHALPPQSASGQLEALVERTEDFTDSAYTSHEQRQAILGVCQLVRQDTEQLVHAWVEAVRPMFILKSICYNQNENKRLIRGAPVDARAIHSIEEPLRVKMECTELLWEYLLPILLAQRHPFFLEHSPKEKKIPLSS